MKNKYSVILADPPWSYADVNMDWATDVKKYDNNRSVVDHYEVMDLDSVKGLPVLDIANENCALFLWCVWPLIYESKEVMESWGFTYRSIAWLWAKLNPSGLGFHTGLGYYTRANTEPCMLAIRGRMTPAVKDVLALIVSPVREHSRKPDEQYGKIQRLYPDASKIELFARRKRPEWSAWGNEIESDIAWEV
jgi:N6-adenosine-specific RNA methylase IME4